MLDKIFKFLAKKQFFKIMAFNFFLKDLPDYFFIDYYNTNRVCINNIIILIAFSFSLVSGLVFLYDFFLSLIISLVIFLAVTLFLVRNLRKKYLEMCFEVEQYSDFICREMILILNITSSLSITLEFLSQGSYPIISPLLSNLIKKVNLGYSPEKLLEKFATTQPSETLREFFLEIVIPYSKGQLKLNQIEFESQWRIRKSFEEYISQIEGKMSIFLAITTIIPLTISLMIVLLGYINFNLTILLPIIFFVFDLIAIEIFNAGKIKILGGS